MNGFSIDTMTFDIGLLRTVLD